MIDLKVSEKQQSNFSFKLDGKELASAIDKVLGVSSFGNASAIMRRHLFISHNKKLYLFGYNQDCCIAIDLKTATKKKEEGSFNIEPDRLKGLVKTKGELDFTYTGSKLKMEKGSFEAGIKTSPVTIDQYAHINEYFGVQATKSDALGSELLKKLKRGVSKTRLVDYTDDGQISPVVVKFENKILQIFANNDYCGAFYETNIEEDHESFSMSVSNEVFNLVSKTIDDDDEEKADFFFMSDHFLVTTSNIYICLPPLQESEKSDLKRFQDMLVELSVDADTRSRQVLLTRSLVDTLSTVSVIAQDRGNMSLKISKGGSYLFESSSDEGNIKDIIKPEKINPVKNKIKLITPKSTLEVSTFAKTIHDLVTACGETEVQVSLHEVSGLGRPNIMFFQTPSDYIPPSKLVNGKKAKKTKKVEIENYECLRQFSVLSAP